MDPVPQSRCCGDNAARVFPVFLHPRCSSRHAASWPRHTVHLALSKATKLSKFLPWPASSWRRHLAKKHCQEALARLIRGLLLLLFLSWTLKGEVWKIWEKFLGPLRTLSCDASNCQHPTGSCPSTQQNTATAHIMSTIIIEGSLEVKLPTIWTDEKQRWEESDKRREEKRREEKKKEDQKEKVSEERRSRRAKR